MDENHKPNSHLLLRIGNDEVDIRLIEATASVLFKKILLPDELDIINKLCSKIKYEFRNFLLKYNSDLQEIYNDGDLNRMIIPAHSISKFQDVMSYMEKLEQDEEFSEKLLVVLPKVIMAIFMYIEQQEEKDLAIGAGLFFRRTIRDFSDRFMEEPPDIVNDIIARIDKRIEAILEENKKLKRTNNQDNIKQNSVFICYSNADIDYVEALKKHFVSISSYVQVWGEFNIKSGDDIEKSIRVAMSTSKILLLMISIDFFNSEIYKSEIFLKTLSEAKENSVIILPVILRPILFEEYPELEQYRTINSPKDPISGMSTGEKEKVWVEIVRRIKDIIKNDSDLYLG